MSNNAAAGTDMPQPAATPEHAGASLADTLKNGFETLGRREQDVAREILREYPVSALCTVAALADRSKVSTATVLRLIQRLGFRGYGAFQEAVKREVTSLLESPSQRLSAPGRDDDAADSLLARMIEATAQNIRQSHDPLMDADFRQVTALLANPRHKIYCVGGRHSRHIAALLADYLALLRDRVQSVEGQPGGWTRYLLEMNAQSIVIAVDIRRYQKSLLRFTGFAAERGARIIAISDGWANKDLFNAEFLFGIPSASPSPIDSHGGQLVMAEALIGGVAEALGPPLYKRLKLSETLDCTDADRVSNSNSS